MRPARRRPFWTEVVPAFVLAATALATATARAAEVRWEKMADAATGPSGRYGHAIAYDVARERTVLFGGHSAVGGSLGDTWEWDGARWSEIAATVAPPPRAFHAFAFDPMRGTVVLFGGYTLDLGAELVPLNDTWEWDGETWREIATALRPAPRVAAALAYDAARGSLLLFGGSDTIASFGDSWELDGSGWTRISESCTDAPCARNGHALASDAARGRVLLFGGVVEPNGWDEPLADTWEWDGERWTRLLEDGPRIGQRSPALAFDTRRDVAVLYGLARFGSLFSRAFVLDDEAGWIPGAQSGETLPPGWVGAMSFDASSGRMVLVQEVVQFGSEFETWELAPIILVGVTPPVGSDAGDDLVSLDGFRLDGDAATTRVRFGDREGTVVDTSDGRLRVRTPALGVGPVDVEIETAAGRARLREGYRFIPAAVAARYGTVNVGLGDREDVLLVNGGAGDPETRVVEAARREPIEIDMRSPSGGGASAAPFALYAWDEEPGDATLADAPFDVGRSVFPFPFLGTSPTPRTTWNNAGHRRALGAPTLPSEPAPSTVLSYPGGLRRPITLTFQGIIRDAGSASESGWSLTNAVILRVR